MLREGGCFLRRGHARRFVAGQGGCFLLPGYAGQHQAMMQGREGSSSGHVEAGGKFKEKKLDILFYLGKLGFLFVAKIMFFFVRQSMFSSVGKFFLVG